MHFITNSLTCAVFLGFLIRLEIARAEPPSYFASHGIGSQPAGRSKYFQYANVPSKGAYNFGFNRGKAEHSISRHEQSRGGSFRSKVKWNDNKGSSGEQYWEYNHKDEGDGGWNKGFYHPAKGYHGGIQNGHQQWASLPKGMDDSNFEGFGYHPSGVGLKTFEIPPWMKGFVNTGYPNWADSSNLKPLANMYGQNMFGHGGNHNLHGGNGNYGGSYVSSSADAKPGFSFHSEDPYQHPGPSYISASLPFSGGSIGTQVRDENYKQIGETFPESEGALKGNQFREEANGNHPYNFDNPTMSYDSASEGNMHQYGGYNKEYHPPREILYASDEKRETPSTQSGRVGPGSMTEVLFAPPHNQQVNSEEQKVVESVEMVAKKTEMNTGRASVGPYI